jgi:hypothetical protein
MVLELHEVATIHIRQGLVTEILISFLLSIWLLKGDVVGGACTRSLVAYLSAAAKFKVDHLRKPENWALGGYYFTLCCRLWTLYNLQKVCCE